MLDGDAVRAIVRARFDDVACERVVKAGEGWDFEVYRVDDCAFRFPKQARWAEQQMQEAKLLRTLGPRLPVAVPAPQWFGEPGADFPFSFVGYPWLAGHGGDRLMPSRARWGEFAAHYGRFLHALHETRAEDLTGVELTCGRARFADRLEMFEDEIRAQLGDRFESAWATATSIDHAWPGEPVLVHNDLCPEHWVFSDDGRLAGVIDWTDARLGDPTGDLSGPWIWFGEETLRQVLSAYGPPPCEDVIERVRARSIGSVMIWIGEWARWESKDSINDRAANLIPRFLDLLASA